MWSLASVKATCTTTNTVKLQKQSSRSLLVLKWKKMKITCPYFVMKLLPRFNDVIASSSFALRARARAKAPLSCY